MKQVFLMLSLLILASCAAQKLAVKHADTLIANSIEKRLPLYSDQKQKLAKDVDQFLMSRKPAAAELLPLIDQIDLSKPDLFDEVYEKLLESYRDLAADFSRLLADHISELNADQQKKFFKRLNAENADMGKKTPEDRVSDVDQKFERLIGPLTKEQETFLNEQKSIFVQKGELRLERRIKLHKKMQEILAQEASSETKREGIHQAFMEFQDKSMASSRDYLPLLKKIIPTMTNKQKETFRHKMSNLKEIIRYYLETDY